MLMRTDRKIENEMCWTLLGAGRGSFWNCSLVNPIEGEPRRVEFSHSWVLRREETEGDVLGFMHTHPSGELAPSQTDVDTMRAWTSCLGKPLLCLIANRSRVKAFMFVDAECHGLVLAAAKRFNPARVVVCDRRLSSFERGIDD